jgi:hypothetical protein
MVCAVIDPQTATSSKRTVHEETASIVPFNHGGDKARGQTDADIRSMTEEGKSRPTAVDYYAFLMSL